MKSTFVFNSINYNDEVMIQNKKVKYEYIDTYDQNELEY